MKKNKNGFSLIELMVVIAIVAVLSAVAVPSYKDYRTKANVAKSIELAKKVQTQLAEYHNSNGAFPGSNSFEMQNPDPAIASIVWVPIWNAIEIAYDGSSGASGMLMLVPTYSSTNNTITWACYTHHQSKMRCNTLPPACQGINPLGGGQSCL